MNMNIEKSQADAIITWRSVLPHYLHVLEHGNIDQKQIARDEIIRLADTLDEVMEELKKIRELKN